ncbi:type I restriction-modification system subunit M [Flavobacteriaceae bacterium XHP0103]|uniref:N-6 DNA methylase n=1 Tax=Marixanthotalea marina TaxID=2844359 RepID=UPI002989FDE0|nr:N-6 DNA methylase [Marixanthotalea marina]MBU3821454.1 type I restriction-modification system subunit M [Marixanthotalea marina]
MAKKKQKTTDTQNLESILFNCREYLRSNASLNDKRDLLLTLVFMRFIGEKFENTQNEMRQECIDNGITDEEVIKSFLNSPSRYKGIAYVPEDARWSKIMEQPGTKLNAALDDAIQELENSGDELKGCIRIGLFTSINLDANVIKKVVDEVNKISHKTFGEEKDLIGRVYEYFLKSFAVNATKEEGEFYTPHDIVELIAAFIEPYDGTLYDPCCGSGGMFIQCAKYVEAKQGDIEKVNVYGQERDPATYRLAKMNLAMRGISHHLGEQNADTLSNDLHKGLSFDFIMANPPFNLKKWYNPNLSNDPRWADYSTPPAGNANYAWILHMLSKLKAGKGIAGFLLANGALGDDDAIAIRQKLIENDKIEAIVVLPRELFYTTDISVTLWILNENKKGGTWHDRKLRNRENEILFMDLRQWRENPVKGEQKKKVELKADQIKKAADIYFNWQSEATDGTNYAEPEQYRSVGLKELEEKGYSLVPSRYIEFVDRDTKIDYDEVLTETASTVSDLLNRQEKNDKTLRNALKQLGYECE